VKKIETNKWNTHLPPYVSVLEQIFGVEVAVGGAVVDEGFGAGVMSELPVVVGRDTVTTLGED